MGVLIVTTLIITRALYRKPIKLRDISTIVVTL